MRRPFLSLVFLACFATGATATVLVVDPTDPSAFSTIQAAVSASSDGDTILVKQPGQYFGFTIDARSLTVTADKDVDVSVFTPFPSVPVTVRNLQPHQTVVIRGIDSPMLFTDNAGAVRVEDCVMTGLPGNCSQLHSNPGTPGADVTNSHSIAFTRCALQGGPAGVGGIGHVVCHWDAGVGLRAVNSTVTLYDTSLAGSPPSALFSSDLFDGLSPDRHFEATSPLRKNQLGQLHFDGLPGDVVLLLIAPGAGQLPVPAYQGVLLVEPITAAVVLGVLSGPDGKLTLPLVITDLPPVGFDAVHLHLQTAFATGAAIGVLGPPSVLTVLDPAF